jgi:hypothetical protein
MPKHIIGNGPRDVSAAEQGWLDLELMTQVEITSEDVDYPIESALIPGTDLGWRAAQQGGRRFASCLMSRGASGGST